MAKDNTDWDDWDKSDKYKTDDDWGYKAKSDAKWRAWETDGEGETDLPGDRDAHSSTSAPEQSWQSAYREAGPFLDVGLHLAITIVMSLVVFLGGGSWLDKRFDTEPVLTIAGALLAFVAMGYRFYAGISQLTKMESARKSRAHRDKSEVLSPDDSQVEDE